MISYELQGSLKKRKITLGVTLINSKKALTATIYMNYWNKTLKPATRQKIK